MYFKIETDKLATAFRKEKIIESDKIAIMLLAVPNVDSTLLAINELDAISYWINAINIEGIIVLDTFKDIFEKIIDKTYLRRVIFMPVNPSI